ncbi:hypothetical protein FBR02_11570, partial [Anaerolineae bacterium CFX9]|nr:hypothetical protein [Anaerolineae bacterium CFX9]
MTAITQTLNNNRRAIKWALYGIALVLAILWLAPLISALRPYRLYQTTITGFLVGGIYALIALGIVIINKASGVFNFAHGWMMLLGGLLFYSLFSIGGTGQVSLVAAIGLPLLTGLLVATTTSWRSLRTPRSWAIIGGITAVGAVLLLITGDIPLIRALVGAVLGAVLTGLAVERIAIRPLIGQPLFATVLMTLALSEVLHGGTQMVWGSVEIPLQVFAGVSQLGIPTPIRLDGGEALGGVIIIRAELLIAFILAL